ncbi:hypothetical protein S7711_10796 [Stachybotrys chartarum IBT 7711]|uniref:Uncharacterized protein n=1 Tax=Stachybotrys chartarum (strain CBS 109288 / IBT 7711) TaxID=1280523 RepID=A0A084AXG7_STACB|nr:hypothetical protein S7711_10796 [Stachybotrys chartarum IBT 7711]
MAAINTIAVRDAAMSHLAKRNWASENPGPMVVFCIVGVVQPEAPGPEVYHLDNRYESSGMVLEGTVYESSNGTGETVADSAEQSPRRFALAILYPSCSSRSLHLINYLIYASWLGSIKYHDFAIFSTVSRRVLALVFTSEIVGSARGYDINSTIVAL